MNKNIFLTALFAFFAYAFASAQVMTRHFEFPFELGNIVGDYALKTKPFTLPAMDKKALAKADEKKLGEGPFQFAVNVPVNINSDDHGVWSETRIARRWTLKLTSTGAFSQTIAFRKPQLRPGATLFVFDGDRKMLFGPIDNTNWWGKQEKLISDVVPGETAYVVFSEPISELPPTRLEIMEVGYGYKNILEPLDGNQDNSPQDLHCAIGNDWRAEARSVVRILQGTSALCSGALVNNTDQNFTPYILTADHCDCGGAGAGGLSFQFFFWANTCNGNNQNSGAITFINGALGRASRIQTDFVLLEMNDDPSSFGVVYAGWNRTSSPATSSRGLHHQGGATMRVAQEDNPATIYAESVTHPCGAPGVPVGAMWRVNFDVGETSGGSSGSPLFNQGHKVVGQLAGSLNQNSLTDKKYGRFDLSWTGGGTAATRLSSWLDGEGMGVSSLNATTRILGNEDVCPGGATYSIPDFRNPGNHAYTYTWTVSSNLTITGGQGTPTATISAKTTNPLDGAEGAITVNVTRNGINVCSAYRIVNARNFPAPADIALSSPNCGSCTWNTFCSNVNGATSFEWKNHPTLNSTFGPPIPMNVPTTLSVRAVDAVGCLSAWKVKTLTGPNTCGCFAGGSDDRSIDPSIAESTTFDFHIVPNPADSRSALSIILPEENATEAYKVKIVDLLGQTILERSGLSGGTQVLGQLKALSGGTYFVQVLSNTGKTSTKPLVME